LQEGSRFRIQDESLEDTLRKPGLNDIGRLLVVDSGDSSRVVGILTKSDIMRLYMQLS